MRAGGAEFYQFDGSSNTAHVTGAGGAVLNSYSYLPFGEKAGTESVPNPFTYAGQLGISDDGNGLYYMRARYYAPAIGRFISEDPIRFKGGVNFYAYVRNNPINFNDPSGLCPPCAPATGHPSMGVEITAATVNPITSRGGAVWGANQQSFGAVTNNYTYSGKGVGLDVGVSAKSVWAWGSGAWTGPFHSVNFSAGLFSGSWFWTPGPGGWKGFSFGLGLGLPGLAYEETNYKCRSTQ